MATGRSRSAGTPGKLIRIAQLVLTVLTAVLAVTVVGTAGHVFHTYKSQVAANNMWWLPLWPGHFETTGTKAAIGTGSGIVLLNAAFILVALLPKFNLVGRPALSALVAVGVALPSILLAISSVVVSNRLDTRTANQDTIKSWTCRFRDNPATGPTVSSMTNSNFETLCKESMYHYAAMIAIVVLQAILGLSAVPQWLANKQTRPNSPDSADGVRLEGKDGF